MSDVMERFTLADVAQLAGRLPGGEGWLGEIRQAALERSSSLGMPTKRDEAWRYTNPKPVLDDAYATPESGEFAGELPAGIAFGPAAENAGLGVESCARVVFVDGRFAPGLSELESAEVGLSVELIDGSSDSDDALVSAMRDGLAAARDGLEALGAGLVTSGVVIRVAERAEISKPVSIVFVTTSDGPSLLTAPYVAVFAGQASRAEVIEDHIGAEASGGLALSRTEIHASRDAFVEHTLVQRESTRRHHVSTLRVVEAPASFVRSNRFLLGGATVRNNIHATIAGDHCDSEYNGLFVPEGRQHHDTDIRIEHMQPDCKSRQYYKGLLADSSRGVFTGRIYVEDVAQKTDAIQSNSNLLLSPKAQVVAKPQLEIYADDVRCTHGATSGMFDDDALFYLCARGVPQHKARLLLLHAFAGENIDRVSNARLRESVRDVVFEKLDAALERSA